MRGLLKLALAHETPWRTMGGLRVREVVYLPNSRQPRHRHAEGSMSMVLAGELEETSEAQAYRAAAGSMVVKPAGYWHANDYGPRGARMVQVRPSTGCGAFPADLAQYGWHEAPRLARGMLALLNDRPTAPERAELAFWEMLDRLSPAAIDGPDDRGTGWWADAVDLLDGCTAESVSVAAVARQVGVHPVYLARVCRRRLGCTVREYIRRRRVLAAWRAWERGDETLAAIALRVGFADQAHMTRAFAAVLGTSPGRLRRLTNGFVLPSPRWPQSAI
jgi:AraC family transcriptional regulator